MANTGEKDKRCWNVMLQRWERCSPITVPDSATGQHMGGSPCCVPRGCCFECKDLIDLTKTMGQIDILGGPSVLTPLDFPIIGPNFAGLSFGYNLMNGRFDFVLGGIYDDKTASVLTCYVATDATNDSLLIPYFTGTYVYPMCVRLTPQLPQCPELGICFKVYVVEFAPTFYTFRLADARICKNVDDYTAGDFCNSCPESIVPKCLSQYNVDTSPIDTTPGVTFDHSFEVCIGDCCLDYFGDGLCYVYIFGDGFIQSVPIPSVYALVPGCNLITVTYNVPLGTPLGVHNVGVLARTLCDDYYFNLTVIVS